MRNKYLIFALCLSLTGCLSPVTPGNGSAYLIKTVPTDVSVKHRTSSTILVMPPSTSPMYNTRDMAYSESTFQISYYAKNSWAEVPSDMLMPLIVKTLQNTRRFKAVVAAPFPGRYNYLLTTEITELLQDYTSCTPILRFGLRAQLSNGLTNQIIAVKEFHRNIPMRKKDPYAGVLAANEAVEEVLTDLADWVTR